MARHGDTDFTPNQAWFDTILKTPKVRAKTAQAADRSMTAAKASAPVDSGDYQHGIKRESRESRYRTVERVVATDPKSLLIEAKTGNLARSVKAAKR
ncbi:HK97 gp10 family phage protein [Leucobacter muris]|uniref:HK97 gp10 family phage protein n=1 Tax=Leucobacter muris TaxID=1935379 RepID=A0ABX5QIM9_9MICO|nr:HK97 gp10 family phage protein [Leucobacter muris]QAB18789.1 HK97 gp10 family phage protein [Leucobacter muris]